MVCFQQHTSFSYQGRKNKRCFTYHYAQEYLHIFRSFVSTPSSSPFINPHLNSFTPIPHSPNSHSSLPSFSFLSTFVPIPLSCHSYSTSSTGRGNTVFKNEKNNGICVCVCVPVYVTFIDCVALSIVWCTPLIKCIIYNGSYSQCIWHMCLCISGSAISYVRKMFCFAEEKIRDTSKESKHG